MLPDVHTALRRLLYEQGGMDPRVVDIAFEPPTRRLLDTLTRPTIVFVLYEIEERTELRNNAPQITRGEISATRRMPPRRMDLRYLVTAVASEPDDEYALMSRLMLTLLKFDRWPEEALPDAIRLLDVPVTGRLLPPGEGVRPLEVWNTLTSADPRSSLLYAVTAPVDLDIALTAPLVLTRSIRVLPGQAASDSPVARDQGAETSWRQEAGETLRLAIGGRVGDAGGAAIAGAWVRVVDQGIEPVITDSEGRFRLSGLVAGRVRLRVEPPQGKEREFTLTAPSPDYFIVLDGYSVAAAAKRETVAAG